MKNSPGPLAFPDVSRPRRRITALSYSFTICKLENYKINEQSFNSFVRDGRYKFYLERCHKLFILRFDFIFYLHTLIETSKDNGKKITMKKSEMKASTFPQPPRPSSVAAATSLSAHHTHKEK